LLFSRDRVREKAKEAVGRRRNHGRRNGRKKRECRRPLRDKSALSSKQGGLALSISDHMFQRVGGGGGVPYFLAKGWGVPF
jgi:hypothetical protein